MKKVAFVVSLAAVLLPVISSRAVDLKQSKFTQVVNDVQVITANQTAKAAEVNDIFKVPDILRTGAASRAELVAADQTITRVGANTIFSFDPANRTIDLQKGSLLFHSPKGRGGGTIQTGSATASVLGTTIVVTTTANGGFKVLVLEGFAEIKFMNGLAQRLQAGQMTFVLPGGGTSPTIVFRLDEQTKNSLLLNGFDNALPSWDKIEEEIQKQLKMIDKGRADDTGLYVGDEASKTQIQAIDPSVRQSYFEQLFQQQNPDQPGPFEPTPSGDGYLSIDGFLVEPADETATSQDAFLAALSLSLDLTIDSPTIDPNFIFINPGPFDISKPGFSDITEFLVNPFAGLIARNINVTTSTIDLHDYSGLPFFDFFAANNVTINGSLTLNGVSESDQVYFTAGNHVNITSGSTITANLSYLYLGAIGPVVFDNVHFVNNIGDIEITSHGKTTLTSGSIAAGFGAFVSGIGGVSITGTEIGGYTVTIDSDFAGTGLNPAIALNNAILNAETAIDVSAVGDVTISGGTFASMLGNSSYSSSAGKLSIDGSTISVGENIGQIASSRSKQGAAEIFRTLTLSGHTGVDVVNSFLSVPFSESSEVINTIAINSGDNILLDNNTMIGDQLNLTAANTINVGSTANGQDLSAFLESNMTANTINLVNVTFAQGSYNHFYTTLGQFNLNGELLPGYTNLKNVHYGEELVTAQSQYLNPANGPGMYSHVKP